MNISKEFKKAQYLSYFNSSAHRHVSTLGCLTEAIFDGHVCSIQFCGNLVWIAFIRLWEEHDLGMAKEDKIRQNHLYLMLHETCNIIFFNIFPPAKSIFFLSFQYFTFLSYLSSLSLWRRKPSFHLLVLRGGNLWRIEMRSH